MQFPYNPPELQSIFYYQHGDGENDYHPFICVGMNESEGNLFCSLVTSQTWHKSDKPHQIHSLPKKKYVSLPKDSLALCCEIKEFSEADLKIAHDMNTSDRGHYKNNTEKISDEDFQSIIQKALDSPMVKRKTKKFIERHLL